MCDVVEAPDHDSDHLSIGTILDLSLQNTAPNTRYSYDQTNTNVSKVQSQHRSPLPQQTLLHQKCSINKLQNSSMQSLIQYTFLSPRLYSIYDNPKF